jgi:phosphatidylethanolamine/phosphatidyl-N-methylethanolamine N-methyltransferase
LSHRHKKRRLAHLLHDNQEQSSTVTVPSCRKARKTSGYGTFLRGLLVNPLAVSAPTPSGLSLSNRLAAEIDPALPGIVVELGPGTGVVTDALIRHGVCADRLLLIESNSYFCEILQRRFPSAKVIKGNAFGFERHLAESARVAGVLSGLPLLNFGARQRRALIEKALRLQGLSGRFVQLSYGWRPAVPPNSKLSVKRTPVWWNLPPAHIWTYSYSPRL